MSQRNFDVDDLFATLFAPATPPASPNPLQDSLSIFSPLPDSRPPLSATSTTSSTDSDFGAFVSVPSSEDPLARSPSNDPTPLTLPVRHPLNANADFFAEARAATARNQQGLLAELLQHQDDPMYWHNNHEPSPISSAIPSGTTTPQPPQPPQPPQLPSQSTAAAAAADESSVDILGLLVAEPVKTTAVQTTTVVMPLFDALHEATSDSPFAQPPSQSDSELIVPPRRPSSSPITRSPSLPPSPSRPSPPILTRVESTSTFSSSSLPSRWMSSFLTYRGPPPSTSPSARLLPERANITHGSPFAAHPFVPVSGAPGFDGDRAWNKGFDAGDGAGSRDRRGVLLLGRKETTRAVLGTPLADAVRPTHFDSRFSISLIKRPPPKKKKKFNLKSKTFHPA
ncbi:hypothetical protein BGW80DRAFT_216051 [Lactifluus volemus]|nr:hypothetical protein BGW80DRAFT_216051 [Lactifluus volemus]